MAYHTCLTLEKAGDVNACLRESSDIVEHKKKQKRRKWVRYECKHSSSTWHTDYKQSDDRRWFISYVNDASGFVTG